MKTDNISMIKVNGYDCFYLKFLRSSTTPLNYYLDLFNIEDYWIYKYTRHQKLVSIEKFMKFESAGYILYKKEKYNKEIIDKWLEYIIDFGGIQFSIKPLPPFSPKKIIIKK